MVILKLGFGLSYLGIGILFASVIWFVILLITTIYKWGKISFTGIFKNIFRILRIQLDYGSKVYGVAIANFFYEPFTKILISNFFGIEIVGYFDIASRIKGQIWGLFSKILTPLLPLFASDPRKISNKKLVNNLCKNLFLTVIPMVIFLFWYGAYFIHAWLKEDSDVVVYFIISLLVFFLIFSIPVIPINSYLYSISKTLLPLLNQIGLIIISITTILVTKNIFGWKSVIYGSFISLFFSFIYYIFLQRLYTKFFYWPTIILILKFIFIAIIQIILCYLIGMLNGPTIVKSILTFITLYLLTFFISIKLRILSNYDFEIYLGEGKISNFIIRKSR